MPWHGLEGTGELAIGTGLEESRQFWGAHPKAHYDSHRLLRSASHLRSSAKLDLGIVEVIEDPHPAKQAMADFAKADGVKRDRATGRWNPGDRGAVSSNNPDWRCNMVVLGKPWACPFNAHVRERLPEPRGAGFEFVHSQKGTL
jgi:hypothetical protein